MHVIRYAKLPLQYDAAAIQAELLCAGQEWKPHFNSYHYSGSWTVMALRSPGGNQENIIPDVRGDERYRDTAYMGNFPSVKKLLAGLNCRVLAARFLNLQAGAVIKQHRDRELAFEKGEARLHFPVITNPGVEFYCEDERIFLNEGECWYLNANLPHRVSNNGTADRIHLVVDCVVNDWLSELINSAEKMSRKEEDNDGQLLKAIAQMRLQNTEASNRFADEWEQKLKEKKQNTA